MNIVANMGAIDRARRLTVPEAKECLDADMAQRSFAEALQLHLDHGTGNAEDKNWSNESFAAAIGVQRPTLLDWRQGKRPPSPEQLEFVMDAFGLGTTTPTDRRPANHEKYRSDLRHAWTRANKGYRGSPHVDPPRHYDLPTFAESWPAGMDERRRRVKDAIDVVMRVGAQDGDKDPMGPLRTRWCGVPDGGSGAGDEYGEADELFADFTAALIDCNEALSPWNVRPDRATDPVTRAIRQRACYRVAQLLSILIWKPGAWADLPLLKGSGRLVTAHDPRLIQCGIDLIESRAFDLPGGPPSATSEAPRKGAARAWQMICNGAIRNGVGEQRRIQLARELWSLLIADEAIPEVRAADADQARRNTFDLIEGKLRAAIIGLRRRHRRFFMLAENFDDDGDPGIAELVAYARRLECTPIAYNLKPSPYIRGDEEAELCILDQIKHCLIEIARIP